MKTGENKVLKAGLWYTISNFAIKGLTIMLLPIFTRLMNAHDIGMFSNITSWVTVLSIITTFEIYSSVSIARFDYKEELNSYISSSLFLGSMITFIFYIIVLLFHSTVEHILMMNFETINVIFIYLLVYPAIQMFQIKNQINYKYKSTIIVTIINSLFATIFSVLFTLIFTDKLMGRIYGFYIPSIIVSITIYIYLLIKGKSISPKYWRYALAISFPLIWHLLAGYLLNSADKIMITKMVSPEATAYYSVAYTISQVVALLWSSMNNAWSPWAYDMMEKKKYDELKNKSKPYIVFFVIIVFCMMIITPELLLIMGGSNYLEAKYVMPPVMVAYIFQFVYSLYVNIEFYLKKQKNIAIGTVIAAIINILLNYIFIPRFGYIASAYTTLVGYIILFCIHFAMVKYLKCDKWYDTKFLFKVLTISLILMLLCNILYTYNMLRYIIVMMIIFIILFILIKNMKNIIIIIKERNFNKILDIMTKENKI